MIVLAFIPDEYMPLKAPKPEKPAKAGDGESKDQAAPKKTEQKTQSILKVASKLSERWRVCQSCL